MQVVPVPNSLIDKVESMFKSEGERMGIFFEENASEALESARSSQENYFRVDLPDGRMMVHLLRQGAAPFNLQFGRSVRYGKLYSLTLTRLVGPCWRRCLAGQSG